MPILQLIHIVQIAEQIRPRNCLDVSPFKHALLCRCHVQKVYGLVNQNQELFVSADVSRVLPAIEPSRDSVDVSCISCYNDGQCDCYIVCILYVRRVGHLNIKIRCAS